MEQQNFTHKMGVPMLYRWLTQRYPEIKRHVNEKSNVRVDNLYLDFNAIIHPCCNKELDNMELTEDQLHSNLVSYVDKLVGIARPHKMIYISIDGVAPRAKLNQQRGRRFVKAKESYEKGEEYFEDERLMSCYASMVDVKEGEGNDMDCRTEKQKTFDSNALTPGTRFMDRLDTFIHEMIKCKLSKDPLWRHLNVIYSSYKVPGEGEQKIMEYIRKHQRPRASHVIFSPDADLIFLGLTLYDYRVMIMREEPKRYLSSESVEAPSTPRGIVENDYSGKDFVFVDIQKLKFLLLDEFHAQLRVNFNAHNFLNDWVLLCFSVGNDFIPCAPCFEIRTNAIEKITTLLISNYKKTGRCITNGRRIDFAVLKQFFRECANREDDFLIEKNRNLFIARTRMNLPYDPQAEFAMNSEAGKLRFYKEKMGIGSERALLVACNEYIKGMAWIYSYYFYEVPSWEWFYPYHFAPFMADLARVSNTNVIFNPGRPLSPFEQLMSVLPSSSKNLIPECFTGIFDSHREMYPDTFHIDTFQKCMEWQAIPIIPFVNVDAIKKEYADHKVHLSPEEISRNTIGYPILYSTHPALIKKTESLNGGSKRFENVGCDEFHGRVYPMPNADPVGQQNNAYNFNYTNNVASFFFDQRYSTFVPKK